MLLNLIVVSMPCSSILRASPGKYPTQAHIQKNLARGLLRKMEICTCSCSILYPRFQFNLYSVFECRTVLRVHPRYDQAGAAQAV